MNIVLFFPEEIDRLIPYSDPRILHLENILGLMQGDTFAAGIICGSPGRAKLEKRLADGWQITFTPFGSSVALHPITLLLGCPRPPVAKRILKDMSTLGIEQFIVSSTDLNEKSYMGAKLWRDGLWRQALIDGAMQAGSTNIPKISTTSTLGDAISSLEKDHSFMKMALDNTWNASSLFQICINEIEAHDVQSAVLAVGPERGWSEGERKLLLRKGFIPARLGQRVLRTETVCTVGIGLILAGMGYI